MISYKGKPLEQLNFEETFEFEKELLLKYPNATINFDVEPTDKELYEPIEKGDDDLPF